LEKITPSTITMSEKKQIKEMIKKIEEKNVKKSESFVKKESAFSKKTEIPEIKKKESVKTEIKKTEILKEKEEIPDKKKEEIKKTEKLMEIKKKLPKPKINLLIIRKEIINSLIKYNSIDNYNEIMEIKYEFDFKKDQKKLNLVLKSLLSNENISPDFIETMDDYKMIFKILYHPTILKKELTVEMKSILLKYQKILIYEKKTLFIYLRLFKKEISMFSKVFEEDSDFFEKYFGIEEAFQLIFSKNDKIQNYDKIREFGLALISNTLNIHEIEMFILFIIQSLRFCELEDFKKENPFFDFLLSVSKKSIHVFNKIYWILKVESDNFKGFNPYFKMFILLLKNFEEYFSEHQNILKRQNQLVKVLSEICLDLSGLKNRKEKIEVLKKILNQNKDDNVLNTSVCWNDIFIQDEEFFLPINSHKKIIGIDSNNIHIFKSALSPILIPFITDKNETFKVIFKRGDDLRYFYIF
jgi:hypothetical protein